MKNLKNFICPDCKGHLRVTDKIVLSVKRPSGEGGLIFVSPEIGDYSVVSHQNFPLVEGEKIDIFCPICHCNLKSKEFKTNLARVLMVDEESNEVRVLFSEIVGQKCTYKITETNVEAFGDDLEEYTNFFGEVPKY